MLPKEASARALRALFRRQPAADLQALFAALGTRSRMSVFRRLREVGYFSSYSHTGRYYTLSDIPDFDAHGLWHYQAIGFSQRGTLRATVAWLVEEADSGRTHAELQALLRLEVYNTLLGLVHSGTIRREEIAAAYLYVSSDEKQARRQIEARRRQVSEAERPLLRLPPEGVVLLVLVEALHASAGLPAPSVVAARLTARGEEVSPEQVGRVYEHFGLEPGKKTAEPR